MNIRSISNNLMGIAFIIGIVSCSYDMRTEQNARERAIKYLTNEEYLIAKKYSKKQQNGDHTITKQIDYWDSLNIDYKAKKAYLMGQQMIRDSVEGRPYTIPQYTLKLDTIIHKNSRNIKEEAEREYAQNKGILAREFLESKKKQPSYNEFSTSNPKVVHYWNLITLAGTQKEAFEQGAKDARNKIMSDK